MCIVDTKYNYAYMFQNDPKNSKYVCIVAKKYSYVFQNALKNGYVRIVATKHNYEMFQNAPQKLYICVLLLPNKIIYFKMPLKTPICVLLLPNIIMKCFKMPHKTFIYVYCCYQIYVMFQNVSKKTPLRVSFPN